jgi:chemotaxis protein MotB
MAKAACKCKEHECEECPEWIFTLADLIMCMMGLFVLLWVLKPEGEKKATEISAEWVRTVAEIRKAFDYLPDPNSKDPVDLYLLQQKLMHIKPQKGPGDGGNTRLEQKGAVGDRSEVEHIRMGKEATVGGRILFEPGEAGLSVEGQRTLDEIVPLIKGHKNVMLVKGHAGLDDFADGAEAHLKLDLSIRRAKAVADYLVRSGVEAEILRVLGCSTFEPVRQRAYSPAEKQLNRRVEVEATTSLVGDFQGSASAAD